MTLNSNRLLIGQGLVALVQTVLNGASPLYGFVKLGNIFDPTAYTSFAEITFVNAKSKPAGSGGYQIGWRIEDDPLWCIASGWDYEADSTAAMINMLTTMDILGPFLHTHYQVPNPNNTLLPIASLYHLTEWERDERSRPVKFPNGKVYLIWELFIGTHQQFNVIQTNP